MATEQSWADPPTGSGATAPPGPAPALNAPPATGPAGEWQPQSLIPEPPPVPEGGWRRAVHRSTRGRVNPGPSAEEREWRELVGAVRRPVASPWGERIAVCSTKGGVGKTTTTLMLGHALAAERGDRVVALDANPDYGTLGYRVAPDSHRTVRDLLDMIHSFGTVGSYPGVRVFTSQAASRLEVLAGDADPAVSEAFTGEDYRRVLATLGHHYNVTLTDCGTGVLHDAMAAVLDLATQLVIVTGPAVDQARHADHLIRWLHSHGGGSLVAGAVVVVNATRSGLAVNMQQLTEHFAGLVRTVVELPYDPVLAAGGIDGFDRLARPTQKAYLRLAAEVAAGFDPGRLPHREQGFDGALPPMEHPEQP